MLVGSPSVGLFRAFVLRPVPLSAAEHGLRPADVYGGPAGAISQLAALETWFAVQRDFQFYSSSGE